MSVTVHIDYIYSDITSKDIGIVLDDYFEDHGYTDADYHIDNIKLQPMSSVKNGRKLNYQIGWVEFSVLPKSVLDKLEEGPRAYIELKMNLRHTRQRFTRMFKHTPRPSPSKSLGSSEPGAGSSKTTYTASLEERVRELEIEVKGLKKTIESIVVDNAFMSFLDDTDKDNKRIQEEDELDDKAAEVFDSKKREQ